MTLSEFTRLDMEDQLDETWDKGVLEDHNTYGDHYYLLYKLYDFFVEIAFNAKTDDITEVKSFQ
jgi:hypothetical protein